MRAAVEVWPGMPEALFKRMVRYVDDSKRRMMLSDWVVTLRRVPLPEDSPHIAECIVIRHNLAIISLRYDFASRTAAEKTADLLHELTHILIDGLFDVIAVDVKKIVAADAYAVLRSSGLRALEVAVESISMTLAQHLPAFK